MVDVFFEIRSAGKRVFLSCIRMFMVLQAWFSLVSRICVAQQALQAPACLLISPLLPHFVSLAVAFVFRVI